MFFIRQKDIHQNRTERWTVALPKVSTIITLPLIFLFFSISCNAIGETLSFYDHPPSSYGGTQDQNGTAVVADGGLTLQMTGNRWQKIDLPVTITPDTVMEFDFQSNGEGEIKGIGFDTDLSISPNRTFQLYGSQIWGIQDFHNYSPSGNSHYRIPIGQIYSGEFDYLFFVNDHDVSSPVAMSRFSNLRIYESGNPTVEIMGHTFVVGNPSGHCAIPEEAQLEDVSFPDHVVGNGSPESCTAEAFRSAVAQGGVITFNCGDDDVVIEMTEPAKVFNNASEKIVIDGGGKVHLSGSGVSRILYMNTCDPEQVWTTPHCQNQDHPQLTVQNLTFMNANSGNESEYDGGGAIWVRGGRFKVINSLFVNNQSHDHGPDVGGGAIRVFSQHDGKPVYVVNSTFGGHSGMGNVSSNGGALSSIGVSWSVLNSHFSHNQAIGNGGNPSQPGTPGGGSGGAIYNDGNTMTLSVCGTEITKNSVNMHGSAIFFITNNRTGDIRLEDSRLYQNEGGFWYELPGISMHSDTTREIINTRFE